jgi:hypothetical protein
MKECTFKPELVSAKSDMSKSVMTALNESKMTTNTQAKYE